MSWIAQTTKTLDGGVYFQEQNETQANIVVCKEFPKGLSLGGRPQNVYTNTVYAEILDPVYVEIDGSNIGGAVYEIHFMGKTALSDTVYLKLIRLDTGALVTEISFNANALRLVKSAAFAPISGIVQYAIHTKSALGSSYQVYGAHFVQR